MQILQFSEHLQRERVRWRLGSDFYALDLVIFAPQASSNFMTQ